MLQVQFIELCKTLYNMFSDRQEEQQLYHSIATVATLLLQIGEVGKAFHSQISQRQNVNSVTPPGGDSYQGVSIEQRPVVMTTESGDSCCAGKDVESTEIREEKGEGGTTENACRREKEEDVRLGVTTEDSGAEERETGRAKAEHGNEESTEASRTKDGSEDSTKLDGGATCREQDTGQLVEDTSGTESKVVTETCLVHADGVNGPNDRSQSASTTRSSVSSCSLVDLDWSITFEQFLASILTEPPLVRYFEEQIDINSAIEYYRNRSQIL